MQETVKTKRRMVRKQFFITVEQNKRLKAVAAARGIAEAELIRAGIDQQLTQAKVEDDDWRTGLDRLSGAWRDRDDMDDLIRDLRKGWARRLARVYGRRSGKK
jgi:hypothetical protein